MTRPSSKLRELVAAGGVGAAVLGLQVGPQPDGLDDVVEIVEDVTHVFQHDGMATRGRDALLQFLDDVLLHEVSLAIVQPLEAGFEELDVSQVWSPTQFFLFPFCEKSLIYLEGKSMAPHRGNNILFCSSQQLPRLRLGPLKGFLS